ncbi:MAG: DUF6443 domain-containing protein [Chitinophagales bacterium]
MNKFLRYLFLVQFTWAGQLFGQTNIPTSSTGPASATARKLPAAYFFAPVNYIRTYSPFKSITDTSQVNLSALPEDIAINTVYADSYGRPLQSITRQASPAKNDYVTPGLFDEFGNPSVQYLPFVSQSGNNSDGKFKTNPFYQDSSFYKINFSSEQINYGQSLFEGSPLNIPKKTTTPGNSWTGAGIGISYTHRTNAVSDSVRLWTIAMTGPDDVPTTTAGYLAGSLFVEEITDERGVKVVSYNDQLGRTVLTKTQVAGSPSTGHTGWLCTYYVCDEMNHVRMVITPKAVEALNNGTTNWNLAGNSSINAGLCYVYYYDSRGRVIMKRIPGKGRSFIAYDLFDRVVMTQDSNLRQTNQWAFVKYDAQSRPYRSGVITTALIKDSVYAQAARSTDYPTLTGTYTIMTEAYYDDYGWTTGTPLNNTLVTSHINSSNFNTAYNTSPEYAQQITATNRIRGAATGTRKLILGTGTYLYSLTLYDEFGRPVQVKETNYTGGTDILTMQYSFAGLKLRTHLQQQKIGTNAQTHTLLTKYSYDHIGRLKSIIKNIDSTGDKIVSRFSYNELGQLLADTLGNYLTTQKYNYDIRGWLSSINKGFIDTTGSTSAYFGEALFYDYGFTNNQYNGAIAGIKWKSAGDGIARAYGYSYDNANRLTVAEFSQRNEGSNNWTNDKVDFTTNNLSYDAGGNILTMQQKGLSIGSPVMIDSLNYQYFTNSNQLQKISDPATAGGGFGDFKDTVLSGDDYSYDVNGNVTRDYNRHMHTTANGNGAVYNLLDKPDSIVIAGKGTMHYYYDASGIKLCKQLNDYSTGTVVSKKYLYLNGFVYLNDTLQYALFEEGRIRYLSAGKFAFDYFLKDHLNNVRMVLTEQKDTAFYPPASLETTQLATERLYYSKVDSGRINKSTVTGYPIDTYTNPNDYVQQLNGNGVKVGTGIVLKVMAGDKFNLRVSSWYFKNGATPQTPKSPLIDLISALDNGIGGISAHGNIVDLQNSNVINPGALNYYNSHNTADSTTRPKAFINWVLFDEQFKYVGSCSGFDQVGVDQEFKIHIKNSLPISKNGYLYVYASNETPNINVYFDNLQVTHIRGPVLAENHYYPFGLAMAGISSKALNFGSPNNPYKFNDGSELDEDESINLYSTFYREYDPQIGRFTGIDVMGEQAISMSNYQFGGNNPIMFNDPMGNFMKAPHHPYGDYFEQYRSAGYFQRVNGTGGGLFEDDGWPFGGDGGGGGTSANSDAASVLKQVTNFISQGNSLDEVVVQNQDGSKTSVAGYTWWFNNGTLINEAPIVGVTSLNGNGYILTYSANGSSGPEDMVGHKINVSFQYQVTFTKDNQFKSIQLLPNSIKFSIEGMFQLWNFSVDNIAVNKNGEEIKNEERIIDNTEVFDFVANGYKNWFGVNTNTKMNAEVSMALQNVNSYDISGQRSFNGNVNMYGSFYVWVITGSGWLTPPPHVKGF